jgi:hypothetical protein
MELVCEFDQERHEYRAEGGRRVLSVTQVLKYAGVCDYDGIPPAILAHAAWRGTLVHEACAKFDLGIDVEAEFDLPEEIIPYYRAYVRFVQDTGFIADATEVERPRIVQVRGFEYAMTPDAVGTINGIPTLIERKCTAAVHASWQLQTAAYEAGLMRPERYRNYQRLAVQLKNDGRYNLVPHENANDFAAFCSFHAGIAWKLNQRIIKLAA